MMGGRVLPWIEKEGIHYPFRRVQSIIGSANIAMANLEAPFTLTGDPFEKKYTFRVPPKYGVALVDAGFDLVTLANNHILDFGQEGLFSTLKVLDSLGIEHCGAGRNLEEAEKGVIIKTEGWQIGFLAFSLTYPSEFWATSKGCGTAYPEEERSLKTIQSLKKLTDIVIVSFHWGGENLTNPKPYQRFWSHRSIENGASLVIGHHPHVLQGIERYREGLIFYSLGNFVFGSYSSKVEESIILQVCFDQKGFRKARVIPICINNFKVHFQPKLLTGESQERVIRSLNHISKDLNQQEDILTSSGEVIIIDTGVE